MNKTKKQLRILSRRGLNIEHLPLTGQLRRISLVRIRLKPHAQSPAIRHTKTDEMAYVISGRGWGLINNRRIKLKAHDRISIPPGTWHTFGTSGSAMEVFDLFAPPIHPDHPDVEMRDVGNTKRRTKLKRGNT